MVGGWGRVPQTLHGLGTALSPAHKLLHPRVSPIYFLNCYFQLSLLQEVQHSSVLAVSS